DSRRYGDVDAGLGGPAEVEVSIRAGWFYHPAEDGRVRSVENILNLYMTSVGRNGKLLLNVPPTRDGLLHATDVARLTEFRQSLNAMFARDLTEGARTSWRPTGPRGGELQVSFAAPASIAVARLEEDITRGQRVSSYRLVGDD